MSISQPIFSTMWAFSIDDRTLLCLAVNVTKHGISNFGRNNFKFSKRVAYVTYTVFQCSLSQGHVTLNRGSGAVDLCTWVRVWCTKFRAGVAWHSWSFQAVHKSKNARNSRCISTVVAYFPTQNSAPGLCMSLQQSSFLFSFSDRIINLDLHWYHNDVWMPIDMDFCKTGTCSGLLCWGTCNFGAKQSLE